ncbi:MAG: pirin family protein [Acidobacteriota bacterium]
MIQTIRANERFNATNDWLSAYWLFSFDFYYDPENTAFGPLRVFNHDTIQPDSGFGMHPHKNMEIVTYVLEGTLDHKDSTGGIGHISAGEVQRMTAGRGIYHSEFNSSKAQAVKLLQMWVLPSQTGLEPGYEQKKFSIEERTGRLLPIASGRSANGALSINQDVTFYVSRLNQGDAVAHALGDNRKAFLYVIEGEVSVNGEALHSGDQARITETANLDLQASGDSEIILIDLP